MTKDPFGRIVLVRTLYMDQSGYIDEVWYAAIDDDVQSVSRIRSASGSSQDTTIIVVGRLSPNALAGFNLAPGAVRSAA